MAVRDGNISHIRIFILFFVKYRVVISFSLTAFSIEKVEYQLSVGCTSPVFYAIAILLCTTQLHNLVTATVLSEQ